MSGPGLAGFPDGVRYVPVPAPLLGRWLREVDTLGELKLTLHVCRLLHERRGTPKFVRESELLADSALLLALPADERDGPEQVLTASLAAAEARGTFLRLSVRDEAATDACILLNTVANRRVVEEVGRGDRRLGRWAATAAASMPNDIASQQPRPTIYDLYEQNVGLMTPLLAEELREAELTYPTAWIEDAFREAVTSNKRSWRYVRRVLETWATRGRGTSGETRRRVDPPADWRKYREGRYGRLINR